MFFCMNKQEKRLWLSLKKEKNCKGEAKMKTIIKNENGTFSVVISGKKVFTGTAEELLLFIAATGRNDAKN